MRLSAIGGLIFAAVLIAGFVLDGAIAITTSGPPQLYASTIGADLARSANSLVWRIELWTYVLAIVPFAIFLPGLRALLSGNDRVAAEVGVIAAALFIVFHTIHNLAYVAIVNGLAPSYVAGSPQAAATEQVGRGLIALAEASFLPGGGIGAALLAVALYAFGTTQRRSGSRATGTLALSGAALTALGYIGVVVGQPALVIALAGWVVFIAWSAVTAVTLLRVGAGAATAASGPVSSRAARSSGASAG